MHILAYLSFGFMLIFKTDAAPVFSDPATNGAACTVATLPEGSVGTVFTTTIVTAQASSVGTNAYALVGTDAAKFAIDSGTGVVTLANAPNIDYDTLTNKYLSVEVTATDDNDNSVTSATCTVAITDVAPTWSGDATPYCIKVSKDIAASTTVGALTCTEGAAAATLALSATHTYFDIAGSNLQTKAGADLTGQSAGTSFTVTATCSDTTTTLSQVVTLCIDSFACCSGAVNLSGISSALVALVLYFMHKLF